MPFATQIYWLGALSEWQAAEAATTQGPSSRSGEKSNENEAVEMIWILSRWWQLKYLLFSPLLGEMIQFDEYYSIFWWFRNLAKHLFLGVVYKILINSRIYLDWFPDSQKKNGKFFLGKKMATRGWVLMDDCLWHLLMLLVLKSYQDQGMWRWNRVVSRLPTHFFQAVFRDISIPTVLHACAFQKSIQCIWLFCWFHSRNILAG